MTKYILSLCVLLFITLPDTSGETHKAPMEILKTGHLRIHVKINGKGPYPLVFDTGAPLNLLSNKIGKEANIKRKPGRSGISLMGPMGEADIASLEWSGAIVQNVPAMILDHPTIKALSDHLGPIEGIVGFPFFARFIMTINYQKAQVLLEANDYVPDDLMKNTMALMFQRDAKPLAPPNTPAFGLLLLNDTDPKYHGLVVEDVLSGSLAEKAKLIKGDILISVNQRWVDSPSLLFRILGEQWSKGSVDLEIIRQGNTLHKKVEKPIENTP